MVIGLTGGIGCGKSAAAAFFAQAGYRVVDTDQLARQVLSSPACIEKLLGRWGRDCLGSDGLPARSWIAAKVFADEAERLFLESVTHPEIARLRKEATQDVTANYVVEIPLLFEKKLASEFDVTVCVASTDSVRLARWLAKGFSVEDIQRRINSQLPLMEKFKLSGVVIWNDGSLEFLREQVLAVVRNLAPAKS